MIDPRWMQIVSEARATLLQHRLRTLLSGLAIVIGVAAISAVLAVGDGLERFARGQIAETTNVLNVVLRSRTAIEVNGRRVAVREEHRFVMKPAELAEIADGLPGLAGATLWESGTAEIAYGDTAGVLVPLVATLPGGLALQNIVVAEGRDFNQADLDAGRAVCLLSAAETAKLDPVDGALGAIHIEGETFMVIGSLANDGAPIVAVPQPWKARVDIDPSAVSLPHVVLQARSVEGMSDLLEALARSLDARYPDWRDRAELVSYARRADQAARAMRLFKAFMVAITGIALLVGGIGIMNVLLMSIGERTREFGIRRALGARAADIRRQLLVESVLMCSAGAACGAAIGIAGAYGVASILRRISEAPFYAAVTPSSVLFAVGASVFVGMVFGVYPARRASKLAPVDAIRYE